MSCCRIQNYSLEPGGRANRLALSLHFPGGGGLRQEDALLEDAQVHPQMSFEVVRGRSRTLSEGVVDMGSLQKKSAEKCREKIAEDAGKMLKLVEFGNITCEIFGNMYTYAGGDSEDSHFCRFATLVCFKQSFTLFSNIYM